MKVLIKLFATGGMAVLAALITFLVVFYNGKVSWINFVGLIAIPALLIGWVCLVFGRSALRAAFAAMVYVLVHMRLFYVGVTVLRRLDATRQIALNPLEDMTLLLLCAVAGLSLAALICIVDVQTPARPAAPLRLEQVEPT